MRKVRTVLAAAALGGVAAAGIGGIAGSAAVAGTVQATGQLVFFQNTNFTGPAISFPYTGCPASSRAVAGQIGSFVNQPTPGCQVALMNRSGAVTVLCEGRGVVPVAFRANPTIRIQAGISQPCPDVGPAA